jgi:hypothetical protein
MHKTREPALSRLESAEPVQEHCSRSENTGSGDELT